MANKSALKQYLYYLPALGWAILIYSLSTTGSIQLPEFNLLALDKLGHMVFYATLTVLLVWGASRQQVWEALRWPVLFFMVIISFAYGASLEFVQATLPHRSFDYADMTANGIGCILGAGWLYFVPVKYWLVGL